MCGLGSHPLGLFLVLQLLLALLGEDPHEQIKEINQWREKKRKIIVIDAEGNQQSKTFVTKMTFKPDLCFLWSNVEFQRHKEKIISDDIKYFI